MAKRRLTPAKVAEIIRLRATGRTVREVAELTGCSVGSVQKASGKMNTTEPVVNTTEPAEGTGEIVSTSTLRSWLSDTLRAARLDDSAGGRRAVVATAALLAKLEPPPAPDPSTMPDVLADAERARERLARLALAALETAKAQPQCPECRRPRPLILPPETMAAMAAISILMATLAEAHFDMPTTTATETP